MEPQIIVDFIRQDNPSSPPPNTPSDLDRRNLRAAMTSPVGEFEPFENEEEILGDMTIREDNYDEDEEGEDLFGDNVEK